MSHGRWRSWSELGLLVGLMAPLAAPCSAADGPVAAVHAADATNPLAAHNAYTWRLYPGDRLGRAMAAGLKHVEIDVCYDEKRQAVVVTHDHPARGGEPELGLYLEKIWHVWQGAPGDGYTLIIDFKSAQPAAAVRVHEILAPQTPLLSSLKKQPDASFVAGKVTVCLTGDTAAHRHYAQHVRQGESYLAFGDVGSGPWQADASAYVPNEPPDFVRFVTLEKGVFRANPNDRQAAAFDLGRLTAVSEKANRLGYRVRVYTLNPPKSPAGQFDTTDWEACVQGGLHMISTDAYELARDWWRGRPAK